MTAYDDVEGSLNQLASVSPAGFAIGLHLEFTTSKYIFQHYSRTWMEEYSRRGLILIDPDREVGDRERWVDPLVRPRHDRHGGRAVRGRRLRAEVRCPIAVVGRSSRSLGSFASSEREFSEPEIAELSARLKHMHDSTADVEPESSEDLKLKRLASSLAHS
jgi:LuxR family transcriptional regulator, quorum-sensing system regulator SdiA